ncbi:Protein kinase-like domain protein [Ophiocordyceps camponoti-floridani]|uniref:Protein kinase-like domain protein n=1 Tax=Ophiocordyceps camponoti-floridani TaxID=2030778 RepID=A0A8H4Q2X0_9HYPO|nr:Protein kinase-like domain protein [Ophiocordyceps camponoti-floridani]
MKTLLVSCLLVAGSASGQPDSTPSCVDKCVKAVQRQSASSVEALRSICGDGTSQRVMFQCLINSCHGGSYGPALGHVAHVCSQLGHDIGPLHPIEVHYALQKRQFIPTAPGPVLPGHSTLYNTQIFTFSHRLSMDLECKAGSDGVLTVSVNDADSTVTSKTPAATHDASLVAAGVGGSLHGPATQTPPAAPHQVHDANAVQANCTSSLPLTSPVGVGASSISAPTQATACPCSGEASSSVFDSPLGSASLLQGPTEQQPVSLLSSTLAPFPTSKPQHTDGEDCFYHADASAGFYDVDLGVRRDERLLRVLEWVCGHCYFDLDGPQRHVMDIIDGDDDFFGDRHDCGDRRPSASLEPLLQLVNASRHGGHVYFSLIGDDINDSCDVGRVDDFGDSFALGHAIQSVH